MKKLSILLIILFIVNGSMAQSCLPQGITFTTQSQIDNFPINYPNCTQIQGDVTINGTNITNLNGLSVLTSIGGFLIIGGNDGLSSLTGLDSLTSIGDYLYINYNPILTTLTGLNGLTSIGSKLEISSNESLTNLSGLNLLTSVGAYITIEENKNLINFSGLDALTSVGSFIFINGNENLTSLLGLTDLTSIGSLRIEYNNALTSLSGMNSLTSIGSALRIRYNNALTSLSGLDNWTSIGGYLQISSNEALTTLSGLNSLTSIEGDIEINYNYALNNLSGLENLASVGGLLVITYDTTLNSLAGLDNIDAGSLSYLRIENNYHLSNCAVQSICDYLSSPAGIIEINNNAPGCNSQQEVELACGVGIEGKNLFEKHFNIYPNPTFTNITFETNSKGCITLLNINGQQLLQQEITEPKTIIDVSTLPLGVYFLKLTNNKTVEVGKLIKK
jgi:hypothetical protein